MTGRPKKSPFLFVNQKIPTNKGLNRKRPLPYDNYCNPDFKNHPINYFLRPITHPDLNIQEFNPTLTHWEQNYYIIYDWNKNKIIIFALYY
jgi:hypothetical protein